MSWGQFAFSPLSLLLLFFFNSDNWCLERWEEKLYDQLSDAIWTILNMLLLRTPSSFRWWSYSIAIVHHQLKSLYFWIPLSGHLPPFLLLNCSLSSFWLPVPQSTHFLSVLFFRFYHLSLLSCLSALDTCKFRVSQLPLYGSGIFPWPFTLPTINQLKPTWPSFCSDFDNLKPWNLTPVGPSLLANKILLKKNSYTTATPHLCFLYAILPPRTVKWFVQGHRAGNCQNWNLNPGTLSRVT